MKVKSKFLSVLIFVIFFTAKNAYCEDPKLAGTSIFTSHCASCHHLGSVLVGPDLFDVEKRHNINWLINFVRSSQTMVKKGDKDALKLFNDFKVVMPDQPDLKEADIINVFSYIKSQSVLTPSEKPPLTTPFISVVHYMPLSKVNYPYIIFYLLVVTTLILVLFFAVTVQVFKKQITEKEVSIK